MSLTTWLCSSMHWCHDSECVWCGAIFTLCMNVRVGEMTEVLQADPRQIFPTGTNKL